MYRIRICKVPQGTAEHDVLCSGLEYLFQKRTCNLGSVLKKQALAADKLEIFLEFQTWAGKAVHIKFNVGYWVSTKDIIISREIERRTNRNSISKTVWPYCVQLVSAKQNFCHSSFSRSE